MPWPAGCHTLFLTEDACAIETGPLTVVADCTGSRLGRQVILLGNAGACLGGGQGVVIVAPSRAFGRAVISRRSAYGGPHSLCKLETSIAQTPFLARSRWVRFILMPRAGASALAACLKVDGNATDLGGASLWSR